MSVYSSVQSVVTSAVQSAASSAVVVLSSFGSDVGSAATRVATQVTQAVGGGQSTIIQTITQATENVFLISGQPSSTIVVQATVPPDAGAGIIGAASMIGRNLNAKPVLLPLLCIGWLLI